MANDVDRAEAAEYGADITLVGNAVQLVTNGVLLGKYRPEDADDEIDIRARYTAPYRNLQQFSDLKIQTQQRSRAGQQFRRAQRGTQGQLDPPHRRQARACAYSPTSRPDNCRTPRSGS